MFANTKIKLFAFQFHVLLTLTCFFTYILSEAWQSGYCYQQGNRPRCEDIVSTINYN